jgi:hypothetical protein
MESNMKPTQRTPDEFVRHHGDLTDLDYCRRRAIELRTQAMRNSVGLKATCIGLMMMVAFPIVFAIGAASLHALNSKVFAQTGVTHR